MRLHIWMTHGPKVPNLLVCKDWQQQDILETLLVGLAGDKLHAAGIRAIQAIL